MSFILDALKKLEQKRQQGTVPDLMTLHGSEHVTHGKRMIWPSLLLIALLLNAGILLAWLRPWKTETTTVPMHAQTEHEKQNKPAAVDGKAQDVDNSGPVKKPGPVSGQPVMANADSASHTTASDEDNISSHTNAYSNDSDAQNVPVNSKTDVPEPDVDENIDPSNAEPFPHEATAPFNMDMSRKELDTLRSMIKEEQNVTEESAPIPADDDEDVPLSPDDSILEFSGLPSEIKEALPDMSISGHIYSNDPKSRMVTINGDIIREGENVKAGLTVDEITLSGVIFTYQGFRFAMRAF